MSEQCFQSAVFKITSNKASQNVHNGRKQTLSGSKGIAEFPRGYGKVLANRLSRVVSSRAARLDRIIILLYRQHENLNAWQGLRTSA